MSMSQKNSQFLANILVVDDNPILLPSAPCHLSPVTCHLSPAITPEFLN
ncbi:hypothetical protein [Trichormus sp. NMC-1]|nr:hypothetical protein [Trichormus sp. NMC-1]